MAPVAWVESEHVHFSKQNHLQSWKRHKEKQLAWPCFTNPEWHYCSLNSYSVLLYLKYRL